MNFRIYLLIIIVGSRTRRRQYGVNINGFVRDGGGAVEAIWLQRRAADKQTWPGKLDHLVGGGLEQYYSLVYSSFSSVVYFLIIIFLRNCHEPCCHPHQFEALGIGQLLFVK